MMLDDLSIQIKRNYTEQIKATKRDSLYKKLRREYLIPKKFTNYNQVILDVCVNSKMYFTKTNFNESMTASNIRPYYEAAKFEAILKLNDPSVYCLHEKLLEAIELTNLPSSLPELEQSIPFGILLLPQELIETGEKDGITYLVFSHYSPIDQYPLRKDFNYLGAENEKTWRSINWFAATKSGIAYCEEVRISDDGTIYRKSRDEFISRFSSILIQSLYFIQEESMVGLSSPAKSSKAQRGHTKQPKTQIVRYPKHLGKEFSMNNKMAGKNTKYPTSRSSPFAHIRRGHRKIVNYGKGRRLKKTVWIPPTWVGNNID